MTKHSSRLSVAEFASWSAVLVAAVGWFVEPRLTTWAFAFAGCGFVIQAAVSVVPTVGLRRMAVRVFFGASAGPWALLFLPSLERADVMQLTLGGAIAALLASAFATRRHPAAAAPRSSV